MNVAEQPALIRLPEARRGAELAGSAEVVEQRGREQEIRSQAGMQLCGLAADRRDADGVLEQATRVAVVAVGRRRQRAERSAEGVIGEQASDRCLQPGVRDLAGEEL